jgi:hypothetical protein
MTIGGGAALIVAAPLFTMATPDYSHNKIYQQGQREGHSDLIKNKVQSRTRIFRIDEDRKAYEAGYLNGHTG